MRPLRPLEVRLLVVPTGCCDATGDGIRSVNSLPDFDVSARNGAGRRVTAAHPHYDTGHKPDTHEC